MNREGDELAMSDKKEVLAWKTRRKGTKFGKRCEERV